MYIQSYEKWISEPLSNELETYAHSNHAIAETCQLNESVLVYELETNAHSNHATACYGRNVSIE